jgi:hypothetical protein
MILLIFTTKSTLKNLFTIVPQALTYFAAADESEDPVGLKGPNRKSVQSFISKDVSDYLH